MATKNLPHNPPNTQAADSPSSTLEIQRKLNQARRELAENEARLIYAAEMDRILLEEIAELSQQYEDAMNAGILAQRAAGAVAEAQRLVGGGL